jgi:hypothetical protein
MSGPRGCRGRGIGICCRAERGCFYGIHRGTLDHVFVLKLAPHVLYSLFPRFWSLNGNYSLRFISQNVFRGQFLETSIANCVFFEIVPSAAGLMKGRGRIRYIHHPLCLVSTQVPERSPPCTFTSKPTFASQTSLFAAKIRTRCTMSSNMQQQDLAKDAETLECAASVGI